MAGQSLQFGAQVFERQLDYLDCFVRYETLFLAACYFDRNPDDALVRQAGRTVNNGADVEDLARVARFLLQFAQGGIGRALAGIDPSWFTVKRAALDASPCTFAVLTKTNRRTPTS